LVASRSHFSFVLLWIIMTGILAAVEARSRVECDYPRMMWHATVALLAGGSTVLSTAALTRVFGELKPWFSPRTWIPISGMLYGNAVTACGLAMSTWTRELVDRRGPIEWRLSRGATWNEAIKLPLRRTFTSALTPVINALSVTGLVHLPGMMTGQILAGQPPYQAAAYQVGIFYLIAASAVVSVQTFMSLAVKQFVDARNDRLMAVESILGTGRQSTDRSNATKVVPASGSTFSTHACSRNTTTNSPCEVTGQSSGSLSRAPVLRVENMLVERTGALVSFELFSGDRIGIKGPSGVGKSQALRTLAGLERLERRSVFLSGECAADIPMPEWRKNVALILQDRPDVDGTPRTFFDELRNYKSVRNVSLGDPFHFISAWGFNCSIFDQPWSALSGGESQVAAVAIALSLKPKVLLLDESTNALDDDSAIKVEKTIVGLEIPVLLVSHSAAQLDRICTTVVNYNDWSR
jgi:putative ABC transport system permease protein